MIVKENDETIPRDYILKNYKRSGNEIKNLRILNSNEYKRQQLIKHQLFTADVDSVKNRTTDKTGPTYRPISVSSDTPCKKNYFSFRIFLHL